MTFHVVSASPKQRLNPIPQALGCAQAEVQGQVVTWLVPHALALVLPVDVDYRVMLTFLEFYCTMLQVAAPLNAL